MTLTVKEKRLIAKLAAILWAIALALLAAIVFAGLYASGAFAADVFLMTPLKKLVLV